MRVFRREIELHPHWAREAAGNRRNRRRRQHAEPGRGEVARGAGDAGGVGAVRRQINVDDGIAQPRPLRINSADRRVIGQFHDALRIAGQLQFARRAQHAQRFDAANDALAEREFLGRDISSRRREHGLETLARIGRAADDLQGRAGTRIDRAHLQAIGVGMRGRLDHLRDDKVLKHRGGIVHILDLEADARECVDDLGERSRSVEMGLEPGQGEFHWGFAFSRANKRRFKAPSTKNPKRSPLNPRRIRSCPRPPLAPSARATCWRR